MKTLSLLIAAYNESAFITRCLENILATKTPGWKKEIIVVDDGSTDTTHKLAKQIAATNSNVTVIKSTANQGKGSAIKKAIKKSAGDICLIQDADLEYDPSDYLPILNKYQNKAVKAVYGSRTLGDKLYHNYHASSFYYLGGRSLTWITNMFLGTNLTDQPTGYKSWRSSLNPNLLKSCPANGFEFEIQLTAYLSKHTTIKEVPIHYYPRSVTHGKKIRLSDFFKSVFAAAQSLLAN